MKSTTAQSKLNIFTIFMLLAGIFFVTYALLVENPFRSDPLDFKTYFNSLFGLTTDPSEIPASRVAVTIFILVLGRVAVWLLGRLLKA
ncbi:MAG: hypothetical protein KKG33_04885 [candidate division Zixibacteria bacterium]|nr:hypothetical protein [candidate division Zixibacteria bacterium]MBU1469122.1 hypothetical protein [candidate division Zixibacteria bacterium]MBU2624877.1 hypothetical protein [candidate division Zixibacteria bacterium]